ncbi:MAG: N-acetylmuramoyl-L-alanine amidase [Coprococcus sp.]|nr:N-acetylmuramoyl-L-alanine amidase [Coprococcus sp.]
MATKIMIDAGHGGYDNGAVHNGRTEKADNLNLALALGDALAERGFDVEYTRTTDVYDSPTRKAQIANEAGADYLISLHRNSSPTPNQYGGVQTLVYTDSGVQGELARAVNSELEKLGFRNINVDERKDLAVLRRSRMPAILIETGFINNDYDNYLFDYNFEKIAEGIANAVDNTID